uniref:Opine dehydrogenase domain-containing protein n=1 Tax=Corethron hystrix TaxID=216773 RepID=A0A7S1BPW5_9STRA|mmetsp:Transcript_36637/g.85621  ORF Transcript_36637/g.85621 Transcript_36637/m.85621 type:complete len:167 (+) Transcript_36637:2-502(+)
MSFGLSRNSRLGSVPAPAVRCDKDPRRVRPNVNTRFFRDDVPHGLCVALGLAELLGFNVANDMPLTLNIVRRLQRWMGKEYVLPANWSQGGSPGIVAGGRDLGETSAPQAFGVTTVEDLRRFLAMSPFCEVDGRERTLKNIGGSALYSVQKTKMSAQEANSIRSKL